MMRKILTAGLSDCHRHHHITKPEVGNPRHNKKSMLLFLVIATALLTTTLSVPTIIMTINDAQASSSSGDNNNRDDSGTDKQMGICVVGAGGPCNGDSNQLSQIDKR
jgi:hypothetical protein